MKQYMLQNIKTKHACREVWFFFLKKEKDTRLHECLVFVKNKTTTKNPYKHVTTLYAVHVKFICSTYKIHMQNI